MQHRLWRLLLLGGGIADKQRLDGESCSDETHDAHHQTNAHGGVNGRPMIYTGSAVGERAPASSLECPDISHLSADTARPSLGLSLLLASNQTVLRSCEDDSFFGHKERQAQKVHVGTAEFLTVHPVAPH